jgi:2-aminoadipate transaminase
MSPEIIFDPYTKLYSEASTLIRSSDIRDLLSITGRSDIISFGGGLPYIGGLPPEEFSRVMNDVLREGFTEAFQYGETEGLEILKSRLVEVMAEEGLSAEPEHVLITTGSQQALDLIGRIFIDPGDTIVMEAPTYVGALAAFCTNGPRIITIPLDDMGMRVDLLEEELGRANAPAPKFVYVVPNFQNPAGVTMQKSRRDELIELAEKRDLLIIEDNPYGLLRFEGKPEKTLASRAPHRVVYLGTLSKIVSPGIRIGWVMAPAPVVEKLAVLKQSADLCSSNLNQMFAEAYLGQDIWKKNLENQKNIYRSRRDAMLKSLEKHFPKEARWTHPQGGLFVWATLPEYLDTSKMLPLAIEQKVAYVPGTAFYPDYSGANHMRLNFSFPPEEQVVQGIKRLGKVIRKEIELYHSLGLDHS